MDVTAFVRVLKDPTGVLWHNFVKYVALFCLSSRAPGPDSEFSRSLLAQLRLETVHRLRRSQESRSNMLHELAAPISFLHLLLPQGAFPSASHPSRDALADHQSFGPCRPSTKYRPTTTSPAKVSPWRSKGSSTTSKRLTNPSVRILVDVPDRSSS